MKRKNYKTLWAIVQTCLFFLPLAYVPIGAAYSISYDEGYIEEVTPRVLDGSVGVFNIEGAVEDWKDSEGTFYGKKWQLEHKELYYINWFIGMFILGLVLQFFNVVWWMIYDSNDFGERDY